MAALRKLKSAVDFLLKWACTILLGIMAVLVVYKVFARQILRNPSVMAEAISQYMFVWMVLLGGAYMFGLREHLNVTVIKDKFSPFINMIVEILIHLTLLVFATTVTINGGMVYVTNQMGTLDAALQIPFGYIVSVLPISGVVMTFYSLYNCALAVEEYALTKKQGLT